MSVQNPAEQSQPASQPPRTPKNGFGVTALVLGIVGAVIALIPILGQIAWPIVIIGLIFGVLGIIRSSRGVASNMGMAIAGTVLSAVGLLICVAYANSLSQTFGPSGNGPAPSGTAAHAVRYEAIGQGEGSLTYETDGHASMAQSTQPLPWGTDIKVDSSFTPISLTVSRSFEGGSGPLGCKILVDGKTVVENHTPGGQAASVTCSTTVH